ncbi:putative 15-hydroxyprostaglandin dehydrogenase (nad(+)) protein [Neofusicoccum parvum UCRNP2]|uniref:Putative 15-hydroxyprostaglandin dehydrogenase (Nad(+)) protein n=1 Tax=Botryosphaeria parva (strain UCR-NP2) TaxID=1287680 RepID=R1G6J1_BOTPV|nr:putative 15-hydroxyprostaglandin dehydrogenase (nad(+)) protein [Neofusicoccum parvum UCRNP2]
MSNPVAIVTGASSGIGLALTQHLLTKGHHVVLLDLNPPPASANLPPTTTLFIRTDVSSWASQSAAFATAHAWRQRLDIAALNAGIDDRDCIFHALAPSAAHPPTEPNLQTFAVNLLAVYTGIKLFAHYAALPSAAKPRPGGAVVVTASAACLHALPAVPQYTATKHGLVGLVRALAPGAAARGFAVSAVCPDMVPTGLAPPGLMEAYPPEGKTPMATMLRAYDELLGLGGGEAGTPKNGAVVEVVVDDVLYNEPQPPQRKAAAVGPEVAALWDRVYRERNVAFARRAEEAARRRMAEEGKGKGKESKL